MARMDARITAVVRNHAEFQRLSNVYPSSFIVHCLTNADRREPALTIGKMIRARAEDPSVMVAGIMLHERAEYEILERGGYTKEQLAKPYCEAPEYVSADTVAKRVELAFHQTIAQQALGVTIPFLGFVFSSVAATKDYGMPAPPYHALYQMVQARLKKGDFPEYALPLTLDNVKNAIELFKLGGEACTGEREAMSLAERFINKEVPRVPSILDII